MFVAIGRSSLAANKSQQLTHPLSGEDVALHKLMYGAATQVHEILHEQILIETTTVPYSLKFLRIKYFAVCQILLKNKFYE